MRNAENKEYLRRIRNMGAEARNNSARGLSLFGMILAVVAGNYVSEAIFVEEKIFRYVIITVFFIFWGLIDRKYLHMWQAEGSDAFKLNPEFMKMKKDIEEIKQILEEIKNVHENKTGETS